MVAKQRMTFRSFAGLLLVGFVVAVGLAAAWGAFLNQSPVEAAPRLVDQPPVAGSTGTSTPTLTPTPCDGNYTYTTSSGVIVPGTNLVPGSQCGGCTVPITLPFAFNFYGQDYTTGNLSTQGNLQFTTNYMPTPVITVCPFPDPRLGPAILPDWDALLGTGWHDSCEHYIGSACGIYTSTSGIAPNRIFNIDWRTQVVSTSQHTAQFEIRLHEGTNVIDFLYAWISYGGGYAAAGLQDGGSRYVVYECFTWNSLYGGLQITWTPPPCGPPSPSPTSTPGPACNLPWSVVTSPPVNNGNSRLYAVDGASSSDVWAVGRGGYPDLRQVFIDHWDGVQWTTVPAPTPYSYFATLRGVSALSGSDVWTVGHSTDFDNVNHLYTLMLHWNGSAWSIVSSPNPGGGGANFLGAVKAISANDVWAVGYFTDTVTGEYRALFLHWNGSSWNVVQGTDPAGIGRRLFGIDAVASNDIWAGGLYNDHSTMFHWNGSLWSEVSVPDIGQVNAVSVLTGNDIWAVGDGGTLHWNGSTWNLVASPVLPLYGVDAISSSDVWAVGPGNKLAHWDGVIWRAVPNSTIGVLQGVKAITPTDLWAVGFKLDVNWQTLTEHAVGTCGTPTPTPTITVTSTPTSTATPVLVGHVRFEGRPPQPNPLNRLPLTLTLKTGSNEFDYDGITTDASGFFSIPVGSLLPGTYNWRVKDPKWLANSGTVTLTGAQVTDVEMGLLRAGDVNNDNRVTTADFTILKSTFGKAIGDQGYDDRADWTGDHVVNTSDFILLRGNFGSSGAPPIGPGP